MRYLLIALLLFIGCDEDSPTGPIHGCFDSQACNYNPSASIDNNSCIYEEENYDCDGNCIVDTDCLGDCNGNTEIDNCGVCGGGGTPWVLLVDYVPIHANCNDWELLNELIEVSNISYAYLEDLNKITWNDEGRLTYLDLSNLCITNIPESICNFSEDTIINLDGHFLCDDYQYYCLSDEEWGTYDDGCSPTGTPPNCP